MKIEFTINQEEWNKAIGNAIKASVRHVLRNDKVLAFLIREEFEQEIKRKVNSIWITEFDSSYLKDKVNEILEQVKKKAEATLAQRISGLIEPALEERNKKAIASLLQPEIKAVRKERAKKKK